MTSMMCVAANVIQYMPVQGGMHVRCSLQLTSFAPLLGAMPSVHMPIIIRGNIVYAELAIVFWMGYPLLTDHHSVGNVSRLHNGLQGMPKATHSQWGGYLIVFFS